MSREPERITPVCTAFARRVFVSAPGVRLTWEALNVGMEQFNAQHDDAQPARRIQPIGSPNA
ncbi:MAG TPA: hypothetical protein VJO99_07045 [Burkholderiaceae bacterium]|nr:hypothetical protein [Burkholderiaceae bacterium]